MITKIEWEKRPIYVKYDENCKPWSNLMYVPHITTDDNILEQLSLCKYYPLSDGDLPVNEGVIKLPVPGSRDIFVYKIIDGFVNFGLWCYSARQRPGHGRLWSSNCETFHLLVGEYCIEAIVNGVALHVLKDAIQPPSDAFFEVYEDRWPMYRPHDYYVEGDYMKYQMYSSGSNL